MKKKVLIISIVLAVLLVIGIILGVTEGKKRQQNEQYQVEFNMVVKTRQFLKTKVNYPESFEYVGYPDIEWHNEETVFVIISGQFKCANAFGVYSSYSFAVAMNPKNYEIISYKII